VTKPKTRHGLTTLKSRIAVRGIATVDRRFAASRVLFRWRTELIDALGGSESVTPQQLALVDLAVRAKLYVDHVDAFLLEQESLVSKKKRAVIPIVMQRAQLAAALEKTLMNLGLRRVPKPLESVKEFVARLDRETEKEKEPDEHPADDGQR
jgi:hypothetical protein